MHTALKYGAPMAKHLEDVVLGGETARHGQVGSPLTPGGQPFRALVRHGLQVEGGYAPLLHHAPRAHAGAAARAVDGHQVDPGLGRPLDGPRQFGIAVGARLEGDALDPQAAAQLLDRT